MTITTESVVAIIFFLLPGYTALRVYEWQVAGPKRATFDEVVWSLLASLISATPLVWLARPLMVHLWDPTLFSADSFVGMFFHLLAAFTLALIASFVAKKIEKARLAQSSIYSYSWDGLWSTSAPQHRNICVEIEGGIYRGQLESADRGQVGRDVVLRNPARWDDIAKSFAPTRAQFMYIAGDSIISVQVSLPHQEETTNGGKGQQQ